MISEGYVQNGAKVYIAARDLPATEKACGELNALGKGQAVPLQADFYKEEDVKKFVEEFSKREDSTLLTFNRQKGSLANFRANRTPRPRQQRRLELGRALRRIPFLRMDPRADAEPAARVPGNTAAHAGP